MAFKLGNIAKGAGDLGRPLPDARETCDATGKRVYTTRIAADEAMHRMIGSPNWDGETLHVYQCDACGGLHFGHKNKKRGGDE
jgi:hypothetical protein